MKILTIIFILSLFTITANSQPFISASEQGEINKIPYQEVDNPNRSIPPGTLLHSQPINCPPYNASISESDITNSETADDFWLTGTPTIQIVRWWFLNANDPSIANWIIRIYDNDYVNCLPSSLLHEWTISASQVNQEYVCIAFGWPIYDYWAELTPAFTLPSSGGYWISIQAVGAVEYWSTWGSMEGEYQHCVGAFKSSYYGFPDFVPDNLAMGFNCDFAFELYGAPGSPQETPLSNWTLVIGIFLIMVLAVIRFRRIN